jgi:serine/threonine protein kinase
VANADSAGFQPGTIVEGRYEIIQLIGSGQTSAVYLAKHTIVGKSLALKVMDSDCDPILMKRFQQEAKCMSRINHANVVKVMDFGVTQNGNGFLAMEYIEGESLAKILERDGALPVKRLRNLFGQSCDALSAVHASDIVHRDAKPANFLIANANTESEALFLTDFAVCKVLSKQREQFEHMGEIVGSPFYMSPEQCMGMQVDPRSDIYGLGCSMYEALTGSPPFQGATMVDTMSRHISDQPKALPEGDPEILPVQSVIFRCLEKKPEDRFQSMVDLKRALVGTPVKTKPSETLRGIDKKKNFWPFG